MATPNPCEVLFMNSNRSDVIFVVDGEEIPGHRLILSAVCPHFETFLYGHFKESNSKHVEIQETSPKVFKELIRFIYKGHLEVLDWTIEELIALMALAHRYEFQLLFEKVVELLQERALDLDSWTLVNDVAKLYDSVALKEKCNIFAESKMNDFIRKKDLDKYPAKLICSMFESPKVTTCNQHQVLSALFEWKRGQSSATIMSVFQKICWEKVSPDITSMMIKELFSNLKNADDYHFWTRSVSLLKEAEEASNAVGRGDFVFSVDSVALRKDTGTHLALSENICLLFLWASSIGFNSSDFVRINFAINNTGVDFQITGIEFELGIKLTIKNIYGYNTIDKSSEMVVSEQTLNNGNFKYCAAYSHRKRVDYLFIYSEDFKNSSQILLRNIVIF